MEGWSKRFCGFFTFRYHLSGFKTLRMTNGDDDEKMRWEQLTHAISRVDACILTIKTSKEGCYFDIHQCKTNLLSSLLYTYKLPVRINFLHFDSSTLLSSTIWIFCIYYFFKAITLVLNYTLIYLSIGFLSQSDH